MNHFQALLLGIIQGITEFFPISSSGHLVLFQTLFGMEAQDHIFFNIVVHFATLLAILIYFRQQIFTIIKGLLSRDQAQIKQAIYIVIATIPVVFVGLLFSDQITAIFSSYKSVGIMMGLTGIYFIISEKFKTISTPNKQISGWKALLIGLTQSVSIIPGVSRSGSTLASGLLLGLDREKSAEFSFLIAIPAISGAVVLYLFKILTTPSIDLLPWSVLLTGFTAAFISGYFSIKFLMILYKKHTLYGFSAYLLVLSLILITI